MKSSNINTISLSSASKFKTFKIITEKGSPKAGPVKKMKAMRSDKFKCEEGK